MAEIENLLYRAKFNNGVAANSAWVDNRSTAVNIGVNSTTGDISVPNSGSYLTKVANGVLDGSQLAADDLVKVWLKRSDNAGTLGQDLINVAVSQSRTVGISATYQLSIAPGETKTIEVPVSDTYTGGELYLKLQAPTAIFYLEAARVTKAPADDTLGIFDGDTAAADGYFFSWSGPANNSPSLAAEGAPPTEVTPAAPTFTDDAINGGGSWTTPTLEGVNYTPSSGTALPEETIIVTATPQAGYVLTGTTEWTHTFPAEMEEPTEVTPAAPTFTDDAINGGGSWTTPTLEGVTYSPASGTATPGEVVTITAAAQAGYTLTGVTEWTHTFPATPDPEDPEPEDPEPGEDMERIAQRVIRLSGKTETPGRLALALEHATIVAAYVHGYTRGTGFIDGPGGEYLPNYALEQVIVSSTARLFNNPEQVTYYVAGDYSERPAVLAGWTLPELAILNNYRRRQA